MQNKGKSSFHKLLTSPYPEISPNRSFITILIISVGVALFLLFLQPFNLNKIAGNAKELFISGYGGVTFVVLLIFLYIFPKLFPKAFGRESWVVWKNFLWLMMMILCIGLGNFLYTIAIINAFTVSFSDILRFEFFTFSIGIIPLSITTLLTHNRLLKRNIALSNEINDTKKASTPQKETSKNDIEFIGQNKNELLRVNPDMFRFAKSDGNYVHIHYIKDGSEKKQLLRSTMKNIQDLLSEYENIIYCHRAFMVNIDHVTGTKGNAQGLQLEVSGCNEKVPVSRKYVAVVREAL